MDEPHIGILRARRLSPHRRASLRTTGSRPRSLATRAAPRSRVTASVPVAAQLPASTTAAPVAAPTTALMVTTRARVVPPSAALVAVSQTPLLPALSLQVSRAASSRVVALTSSPLTASHGKATHLTSSAIAGIAIGAVCIVAGALAFVTMCLIRQRRRKAAERGWWATGAGPGGTDKSTLAPGTSTEKLLDSQSVPGRVPSIHYVTPQGPFSAFSGITRPSPEQLAEHSGEEPVLHSESNWARKFGFGGSLRRLMSNLKNQARRPNLVVADGNDSQRAEVASNQPLPSESSQTFAAAGVARESLHGLGRHASRSSRDHRKTDTVMDLASMYGAFGGPHTSTPARRSGIRKSTISRPSLDGSIRSLQGDRAPGGDANQRVRRSRAVSVSSARVPLQPKDENANVAWRGADASSTSLEPSTSIKRKAAPMGLGLGHPGVQPQLIPTTGPSANKQTARKLSPVIELDSRDVSFNSAEVQESSHDSSFGHAAPGPSSSRSSLAGFGVTPPLRMGPLARRSPALASQQPLQFTQMAVDVLRTPTEPDFVSPLSPFVTESARRVSVVPSSALLVHRPGVPPRKASDKSEAASEQSDEGRFRVGNALLQSSPEQLSDDKSPSLASTAGPVTPALPSLAQISLQKHDPYYNSATLSIYGLYGDDFKPAEPGVEDYHLHSRGPSLL